VTTLNQDLTVVKIQYPALFILDYEANTKNAEMMGRTMPYFIKAIRSRHFTVPIMVLTKIRYAKEAMDTVPSDNAPLASGPAELREIQRKSVRRDVPEQLAWQIVLLKVDSLFTVGSGSRSEQATACKPQEVASWVASAIRISRCSINLSKFDAVAHNITRKAVSDNRDDSVRFCEIVGSQVHPLTAVFALVD